MARRSSVRGAAAFKRTLRALPSAANNQLISFLTNAGMVLAEQMKSELPVLASPRPDRTPGALRASISYKVTPATLNLKVGEVTKADVVFYGHILDVGRRAGNIRVTRGTKVYPHGINVSALAPLYVVSRAKATFRNGSLPGYRTLMDQILAEASQGIGSD